MKTIIFIAIMCSAVSINAQTLKETLFGGKLKTDSGTVIHKGDDLSTKIDTTTKKPVEIDKAKLSTVVSKDSSFAGIGMPNDSSVVAPTVSVTTKDNNAIKDNNKVWKDYLDSLTGTLRSEVLTSKKIKSGTYSVLIEYEIGVDGSITVNNVSCEPESSFLAQQIKERITLTAPQMTPLMTTTGKPRKSMKKQMLTLAK
jgi:hypothetical protein